MIEVMYKCLKRSENSKYKRFQQGYAVAMILIYRRYLKDGSDH